MSLLRIGHRVFAGTLRSGLFIIDLNESSIRQYISDDPELPHDRSISNNGVTSIEQIDDNLVAIGTYGGGLNIFNVSTGQFKHLIHSENIANSLSDDRVICLHKSDRRTLWIGTQNGLNKYDPTTGAFEHFMGGAHDSFYAGSPVILSLNEDHTGELWIGTQSSGVFRWNPHDRREGLRRYHRYSKDEIATSSDVYGILEDHLGAIWLTHNAGLTRIDPERSSLRTFDLTNGLQGPEFNHGASSVMQEGLILAGGPNGFNIIDPDYNYTDNFTPRLSITSIKIMNRETFFPVPYNQLKQISLDNGSQFLSIDFSSLDYRQPSATRYRYRISELQSDWLPLEHNRTVSVYGLKSGDYNLQIEGTNASGFWSNSLVELGIRVPPPWWATKFAYLGYIAIISLIAYSVILEQRRKRTEELSRRLELEQKVRERTNDLQLARIEAESAAKAKADFLASMSHELRTPIHGIIGVGGMLVQSGLTRAQESLVQSAIRSGHSLLEVITSILEYSRLEAGKIEVTKEEFCIVDLIDEVTVLLLDEATKQDTSLTVFWDTDAPHYICGDEGKVRQIIINLVGNAIKFTKEGTVTIHVAARLEEATDKSSEATRFLRIDVVDTGIGIDKSKHNAIFEMFTQADTSTTRDYGGTGLGLSISHDLATLMSGTLTVESEVGKGSTFTLEIPIGPSKHRNEEITAQPVVCVSNNDLIYRSLETKLRMLGRSVIRVLPDYLDNTPTDVRHVLVRQELFDEFNNRRNLANNELSIYVLQHASAIESPTALDCELIPPPYTNGQLAALLDTSPLTNPRPPIQRNNLLLKQQKHILVVEDLELNQRILLAMLQRIGATYDVATNGLDAVESSCSAKTHYDAIFMDCQMPLMDGFEATVAIRKDEADKQKPRVPIIALTASADASVVAAAIESGMDEVMQKPFSVEDIYHSLSGLSNNHGHNTPPRDSKLRESTFDPNAYKSLKPVNVDVVSTLFEVSNSTSSHLLDELTAAFSEQLSEKLSLLQSPQNQLTTEDVRRTAHAIKSMSANIGAERLKAASSFIEKNSNALEQDDLDSFVTYSISESKTFLSSVADVTPGN